MKKQTRKQPNHKARPAIINPPFTDEQGRRRAGIPGKPNGFGIAIFNPPEARAKSHKAEPPTI